MNPQDILGDLADGVLELARKKLASVKFALTNPDLPADVRRFLEFGLAEEERLYTMLGGDPSTIEPDHVHARVVNPYGGFTHEAIPVADAVRDDNGQWWHKDALP